MQTFNILNRDEISQTVKRNQWFPFLSYSLHAFALSILCCRWSRRAQSYICSLW